MGTCVNDHRSLYLGLGTTSQQAVFEPKPATNEGRLFSMRRRAHLKPVIGPHVTRLRHDITEASQGGHGVPQVTRVCLPVAQRPLGIQEPAHHPALHIPDLGGKGSQARQGLCFLHPTLRPLTSGIRGTHSMGTQSSRPAALAPGRAEEAAGGWWHRAPASGWQ